MTCEYCKILNGERPAAKVYEDDKVLCILAEQPATAGHIQVIPKQHVQIFEMLPDDIAVHTMIIANKMGIALFETIKAQGTNIITQNGVAAGQSIPHFVVNVIARREGDGLMFDWLPKKLSEEEMGTIEMQLKQEIEGNEILAEIEQKEEDKPSGEEGEEKAKPKEETDVEKPKEENYLVRQLKRMP